MVAVDPFFPSSKRGSRCDYTMPKMALKVRSWVCPECGVNHARDVNAGKNIKAAGLAMLAPGESVTPELLNAAQVRLSEPGILAVYGGEQSKSSFRTGLPEGVSLFNMTLAELAQTLWQTANRKPQTANRKPQTANRKPQTADRSERPDGRALFRQESRVY